MKDNMSIPERIFCIWFASGLLGVSLICAYGAFNICKMGIIGVR